MSDFNSCDFGAISPNLVLRSLLSGFTGTNPSCGLRTQGVDTSAKTLSRPFLCSTFHDFMELVQRSLIMAYDGKVAIRVTETTSLEGVGLDECLNCGDGYSEFELLSSMFVQDEDGVVYLNLVNIST